MGAIFVYGPQCIVMLFYKRYYPEFGSLKGPFAQLKVGKRAF